MSSSAVYSCVWFKGLNRISEGLSAPYVNGPKANLVTSSTNKALYDKTHFF